MSCAYCESATNDFVVLNQTVELSGIEVAINRQGMLRVRVFDDGDPPFQDVVNINHCPACGRRFTK